MLKRGLQLLVQKRDFGLLMLVQFAAQAGDAIIQTSLAKFIVFGGNKGLDVEAAPSPDVLLSMVLFLFVPYTIISPFLGVVIDRWDRRRLLFGINALRAAGAILVGFIGIERVGNLTLLIVFLLTLAATRIVLATKAAALPTALGDKDLVEGNAVSQLGGALFQLGGGGVALVATLLLPAEPVAVTGGIVCAVAAAIALRIRHAGETRESSTLGREIARVLSSIWAGLREVARTPKAGAAITTYFWLRFLWSLSIVGIGFIAKELVAGNDNVRLVLTAGGGAAGAVLGFLLADKLRARVPNTARIVLLSSALAGLGTAALGALEIKAAIVMLTFFLGLGFFLGKISLDTLVQEALGDDFRGRAFSLYDIAYNVAWVMAAVIMKIWWTDLHGVLIATMGVVFLIGLAALAMWYRAAGLLALQRS
ncbi:MAG TPA: MFS transporter [Actinomycetota bacterium]|nr:MFS transporter [Actinomycetota bacterium]